MGVIERKKRTDKKAFAIFFPQLWENNLVCCDVL